ncbi:MAG: hypothetical protein DI598_20455 [Pseudopedobacter saltans]|uniref:DUF3164 domain-containing protein n=1 Tax=Pseudopedobacter saltans TaxID=151895 RepID=A0A2W5FZU1_9SPHI|nr:MAG: hypothetical protein DI598_20455 [Pseudopedobacter saltans]
MSKLSSLTPEEKAALMEEAKAEIFNSMSEKDAIKIQRNKYKEVVNDTIPGLLEELKDISALLSKVKTKVFNELKTLIELKAEVFGKDNNILQSHTFTTEKGDRISVGYRMTDDWDDTVSAGLQKVHDFIQSLAKDDNSAVLVKAIMRLLAKDKKGNLQSSRVLQLKQLAEETGNEGFIDAVGIIHAAYRPRRSAQFISASYRDENLVTVEIPLDITSSEILQPTEEKTAA